MKSENASRNACIDQTPAEDLRSQVVKSIKCIVIQIILKRQKVQA